MKNNNKLKVFLSSFFRSVAGDIGADEKPKEISEQGWPFSKI